MEKNDKYEVPIENSISTTEANMKKARIVSSIIEKAEQGDEEENKGRS